ncbi:MAG TPA: reverse transcriptase family protein, partial [Bacillus sp. (in: firmicutes)]|nr:reverse transcriptase family protein [Bacillus sp. (in: firmicutes)]
QLTMTNDQKEERFMKVQIEETDQTLQIDEERKTVIGEMDQKQRNQLQEILQSYEDVIAKEGEIGRTNAFKHKIYTEEGPPISQRAYRMSPAENEIIKKEIDNGLEKGLIRPSNSLWASPVVLVKKKNGKTRFCVDYRKLNDVTKKDKYPLPLIHEIIDNLQGASWFTSIDLASGYWQVEVAEESKEKTAFITKYGLYEYNVMPFGLCNAPATFQRLMNNVLGDILWKYALDYIDDITIYSKTWEDHVEHIKEVLSRLRSAGLKINPDKCHFAAKEVQFLGHIVGIEGIKPDPDKVIKIQEYPEPRTTKELRRFIGMVAYYRKFIKEFSRTAKPLFKLLEVDKPYLWEEEQQHAFDVLKGALVKEPILSYPDLSKEFILTTDASKIAVGAVLSQKDEHGKEHPIAYDSRTLHTHEQNYDTTNLEALAVIWALGKFRHYLHGRKFKIYTDHSALVWLLNNNQSTNGRHSRWRMILQEYDYEIIHKKGKYNSVPDALSRVPQHPSSTSNHRKK